MMFCCWKVSKEWVIYCQVLHGSVYYFWYTALHVHTSELRDVHHLSYGITQCYLPPDTGECALLNPSQKGWYWIYIHRRIGRLSWFMWLVLPRWFTCPETVTNPSINRARRRVFVLMKNNALLLSQATTIFLARKIGAIKGP